MKLRLITVGKLPSNLQVGVDDYIQRLGHYLPTESLELKEEKSGKKTEPNRIRQQEGERILAKIGKGAVVILLDELGKEYTSEKLAATIERYMIDGTKEVVMIIGGAYGVSEAIKARANATLALSKLTLTHQMARLFLTEQLYRAMTIIRNEPYHNR